MFLRSVKSRNGQQEYLRLVESFREGEKVKQRIVAHLGRKDILAPHLDALIRLLAEPEGQPRWVAVEDISAPRAATWGASTTPSSAIIAIARPAPCNANERAVARMATAST